MIFQLGFFDRRIQRLEKEGKVMLERCEGLKLAIISHYEMTKNNKFEKIQKVAEEERR